jgi:hypothetical protein
LRTIRTVRFRHPDGDNLPFLLIKPASKKRALHWSA